MVKTVCIYIEVTQKKEYLPDVIVLFTVFSERLNDPRTVILFNRPSAVRK